MTAIEYFETVRPLFPGLGAVGLTLALGLVCAVVLTPAERLAPAHPQPLVWRKELWLDVIYWFATPLLTRCVTAAALAGMFGVGVLVAGMFGASVSTDLMHGFGPLARQPWWLQAVQILLLVDFVDYWTHRTLHRGRWWRIHAIHHSPEQMNWISSARVHPLNDLITRSCQVLPVVGLGFSPAAVVAVVPLISFYVMFLHSNVRWDFGPLRWVLVSPAYHRWHHTSDDAGIDRNFAGIFPVWDLVFGTAHFPKDKMPRKYGLVGYQMPESFAAHLMYPFRCGEGGQSASVMGRKDVESGRGKGHEQSAGS